MPHDDDDEEDTQRSWKRSVKSVKELLIYISSLEPHSLTAIKSIYNATNIVSTISKLLLDTMECIFKNVNHMEEKKKKAEIMKEAIERNPTEFASEELNELLHITQTKLVCVPRDQTGVVCESPRCAKVVEGHTIYPQVCYTYHR